MSEPFLAEIRIFGFNFPPRDWAECDGQILPINQNQSLYSLLGTTYGGDGRTSFGLPDLRGRTPLHEGQGSGLTNRQLGSKGGVDSAVLSAAQMPNHTHPLNATTDAADNRAPDENVFATTADDRYGPATDLVDANSSALSNAGSTQPHQNMQPYQVLNFCIALRGVFPSRN